MKRYTIFIVFAALVLASCTKPVTTSCGNSVTFTIPGGYTNVTGCPDYANSPGTGTVNSHAVGVSIYKTDTSNTLLLIVASSPYPYTIGVVAFRDTMSKVGVYTVFPVDSFENAYSDNLNGNQSYKCSGGTITVSRADSSNIKGAFSINVFNQTLSKVVNGSFVINQPVLQ